MKIEKSMKIESSAFKYGERIPPQYTCDGAGLNPPLAISDVPANAKSLALIMDDPDASRGGTWVHWLVWNISPGIREIKEGISPSGAIIGSNSWPKAAYGGPCPPASPVGIQPRAEHRYFLKLYALDMTIDLPSGSLKQSLVAAMNGHILMEAELMGRYQRI